MLGTLSCSLQRCDEDPDGFPHGRPCSSKVAARVHGS
uniref:Uncharacterized protein n=1 Tax=Arundo donax TaxID=35708 RepID=A0A0A9C2X2_ARUDO